MTIEMPRGLPFSVDTWTPSSDRKGHHFLTHAHKDHSQGITTYSSFPIYSTHLTKSLLLLHYPQLDDSLFVQIEVGQSVIIEDPDGDFTVTAFDANHCPGAVMFLFEGYFGNILHTGDCRLTPECLQNLPEKYLGKKGKRPNCSLDYIFLDCTFGRFSVSMPSRHSAIRQVISCIWKHPDALVVYLTCDLLGQEEILVNVSQTFGSKIYVDKEIYPECFRALTLTVPEILSDDQSSRFQMFGGFPKLYEQVEAKLAEARVNFQLEPLIIRPSAQWYARDAGSSDLEKQLKLRIGEAVRDQLGVWHVCYSIHSSKEELEWALHLLAPKQVVSTTPGCWAMDLDYVQKHCFKAQLASDDSLWKLLDIGVEAPSTADASAKVSSSQPPIEGMVQMCAESKSTLDLSTKGSCSPVAKGMVQAHAETESLVKEISTGERKLLNLFPMNNRPPITLFGRARVGLKESTFLHEEKQKDFIHDDPPRTKPGKEVHDISFQKEDAEVECETSLDSGEKGEAVIEAKSEKLEAIKTEDVTEPKCEKPERETRTHKRPYSTTRSSKGFTESFRKLYRSMNVPVPQPLPSLVEFLKASKSVKRRL